MKRIVLMRHGLEVVLEHRKVGGYTAYLNTEHFDELCFGRKPNCSYWLVRCGRFVDRALSPKVARRRAEELARKEFVREMRDARSRER